MRPITKLSAFLDNTIRQEGEKPIETLAGYIVGELLGDYDNKYADILDTNPDIGRIGALASDLEWSNGSPEELDKMWQELKTLASKL